MTERAKNILVWATALCLVVAALLFERQYRAIHLALALGIAGTFLIVLTEVGYTSRKSGMLTFGNVNTWLRIHIITGLVGIALILWHSGFDFFGFAGWLLVLMAVVVVSGLIGHYIYRQIPRSLKGQKLSLAELDRAATSLDAKIKDFLEQQPSGAEADDLWRLQFSRWSSSSEKSASLLAYFRSMISWRLILIKTRRLTAHNPKIHDLARELIDLETQKAIAVRRVAVLSISKTLMSQWRIFHIPLTLGLFAGILIHVISAFYYGRVWPW
jgi:hypothetical protein